MVQFGKVGSFEDKGRCVIWDLSIHTLDYLEEILCYTFSTGHLTKVPLMKMYESFTRAM